MKTLILAAGKGSRTQGITKNLPKSLFPLNHNRDSTLSILINNLAEHNLTDFVIVGGYEIDYLSSEIGKICPKSCNYVIVDANPDYKKGPIYSFLSATIELIKEDQFLLLPADSIFTSSLFKYIVDHEFSKEICHLFYYKSDTIPSSGSQCLVCNFSKNSSVVENIVPLEKWKEEYLEQYNFYPILVPVIILPSTFFEIAKKSLSSGAKNVISPLHSYCIKERKCFSHQIRFKSQNGIFYDFDTPNDLEKIRSIIK
ncbi:NTP transferase domain-containing protein [Promethearchaeum syntrophicum]|uniref:NTP transferase domain-containing protein n=1 Tax=Promethearchaeum syntrophicum TaxID=2594042 RepID=A0A5B9D9Y3_9ARCH